MSHSLQRQIQAIAARARRLLLVHGICWFAAVVLPVAFVFGWIDYSLRLQDQGVRLILSIAFGLICVWSLQRFVVPSFRRRFDDLEVAQRVEQRFPQLGDRLSSSLAFLSHEKNADQAESRILQQSVITETEALVRPLQLAECLDLRATRRSLLVCIPLLLVIGAICSLDLDASSLAARRLATPWRNESWPRWNSLAIVNAPQRIALGQDFVVEVTDGRGRLPKDTTLHFWFEGDDESEIETAPMQRGERHLHYTRRNVTRAFRYRATGGDDNSMEWRSLIVVEPAQISDFRIAIEPPAYSGIAASESTTAGIRVLQGSQLSICGRTSRPVQAVRVHRNVADAIEVIDAKVHSQNKSFTFAQLPTETPGKGNYWIELVESDGVVSGSGSKANWEVVADHAPLVSVLAPTTEMSFTADATVPIRITATDDIAVQSLHLQIGSTTIPLFVGPEIPPPQNGLPTHADVREVVRDLKLSEFQLSPHDTLQLAFVASDYLPQTSVPVTRAISIISREDFDYRSQERQKMLLARLIEALRLQRATLSQLEILRSQLKTTSALSADDVGRLRSSELQQEQVARLLDDSPSGAARLIGELIASIKSNQMAGSETAALMERLSAALDQINRRQLPELQSEFVRATKAALATSDDQDDIGPLLESIVIRQDAVSGDLQKMVDRLSQWDDYRRFARDVAKLLRDQQELSTRVNQLPTIGQRLDTLSAQQRADLARASGEQLELAQRVDRVRAEMDRLREPLLKSDPSAAAALAEAVREASTSGIAEQMREIGSDVAKNRLGNASQAQANVERGLEQVLGALTDSQRRSADPDQTPSPQELAAGLAQLKTQLADFAIRQQTLLDATGQWQDSGTSPLTSSEMTREQRQLRDETNEARERLSIPTAFSLGMKSVETIMGDAAMRLENEGPDDGVYRLQDRSLTRLEQLLAALESQSVRENSEGSSTDSPNGNNTPPAGAQQAALSVEELRLLHSMQVDLYDRTAALEALRQSGEASNSEVQQAMQRLANDQGELAALLLQSLPLDEASEKPAAVPSSKELNDELDRALERAGIPSFGDDE
ncbi:MAG TPA: hypothetical protein P5307_02960 [Pirellulaceae bacterium]|nr:hypothetical protein [Planctomycetaceae bacterium]HRX77989.1 hypothetical protein [Pirellulaceae bacterium]